ncbi:MAG TPA: hypothetical protein VFJ16_15715 [Longimicrobium sp.]|nr:hypothetical protein [Longimicrobium sp.]
MIPEYWPDEPSEAFGELPELLERYFNDYERGHATWPETRGVIIMRLLEKGGYEAVRWLQLNVGDDELREFITGRSGRGMHPRRLRYWQATLDLPAELVDAWVEIAMRNPWYRRTHSGEVRST